MGVQSARLDDAEHEMTRRAADPHAIDLDTLLEIARGGWALHPLIPGTKKPATKHGLKDATTDEGQLRAWHEEEPGLGWGTPTATVADIDRADQLEIELPLEDNWQDTPSGGRHILMRATDRRLPGKLPGNAGEWRPDGKAYVKIYDPQLFAEWNPDLLPEVPEEAFVAEPANDADPDEGLSLTTREELIALVGRLRSDGLEPDDIRELLERMKDDGRIYDSDPKDPWTTDHFMQLAREAGKWKRGEVIGAPRVRYGQDESDLQEDGSYSVPLAEVDEEDPQPLLLDALHPAEHSILFGTGGTGKGVLAAWWAVQLVLELDMDVLIVDYEQHAKWEWRPRVRQFTVNYRGKGKDRSAEALNRIRIVQPLQPIWKAAPRIAADVEAHGIDYVIIDSITYAVGDAEAEKSTTATKYSLALAAIPVPALSLAHTTKADADPRYPFGSVYWHNGARITMSLVGDGVEPRILTQKKTNQRAMFAAKQYDWSWSGEGETMPEEGLESTVYTKNLAQAFVDWVVENGRQEVEFTTQEIQDILESEGHSMKSQDVLRSALNRGTKSASLGLVRGGSVTAATWRVAKQKKPARPRVVKVSEA